MTYTCNTIQKYFLIYPSILPSIYLSIYLSKMGKMPCGIFPQRTSITARFFPLLRLQCLYLPLFFDRKVLRLTTQCLAARIQSSTALYGYSSCSDLISCWVPGHMPITRRTDLKGNPSFNSRLENYHITPGPIHSATEQSHLTKGHLSHRALHSLAKSSPKRCWFCKSSAHNNPFSLVPYTDNPPIDSINVTSCTMNTDVHLAVAVIVVSKNCI